MSRAYLRPAVVVAAVTVVFAVVRVLTLRHSASVLTAEVCEFGLFPEHLNRGLLGPVAAYMPLVREGGTLLYGLVCAPLFAVLGPSFFSLRLSAVVWHAGMLAVFGAMAWRLARGRGVWLLGALWTLAPPALVKLQQMGWASHLETALFGGLALGLLALAVDARRHLAAAAAALGAGAMAGLALFFTYSGASMLAGLLVAAAWGRVWRRGWGLPVGLLVGLGLGFLPIVVARWVWFDPHLYWELAGGDPVTFLLGGHEAGRAIPRDGFFQRLLHLAVVRFPVILGFDRPAEYLVASGRLYLVALLALVAVGFSWRAPVPETASPEEPDSGARSVLLVGASATVLLHLVLCAASDYQLSGLQDRYMLPVAPFVWLLAAHSARVRRAATLPGNWRLVVVGAAALVALAMGGGELVRRVHATGPVHVETRLLGYRFTERLRIDLAALPTGRLAELVEQRPEDRFELLRTHGEASSSRMLNRGPRGWWASMQAEALAMPPAGRAPLWEGIGRSLASTAHVEPREGGGRVLPARDPSSPHGAQLLFGVGDGFRDVRSPEYATHLEPLRATLPRDEFACVCAGVGARLMHHRYGLAEHLGRPGFAGCSDEWLAVGMGVQLARETLPEATWGPGEPILHWWFSPNDPGRSQRAFLCAYEAERRRQESLASPSWGTVEPPEDPLLTCLVDTAVK